jgi:hypothetical protein
MAASGSFAVDLSRLVKKAQGNIRFVVKKIVIDAGESVIAKTPVGDPTTWKHPAPPGYVGGRARGSWQYGFNAPTTSDPGTVDGKGGKAEASESAVHGQAAQVRVAVGAEANTAPGVHYITSTLPYMRRLEYEAWSQQAPAGMVRQTVLEFKQYVDQAVAAVPK